MIWTVYLDETDTHGAPVMALGGFLSTAKKWKEFDKDWIGLLSAHNLEYSHAQELVNRRGQFKGWSYRQWNEFVFGARAIMNRHLGVGFVSILRDDDYISHYKVLPKPRKWPQDTKYGVLFRACVSFSLSIVDYEHKGKTRKEVVNFVLENGGVKPGYARQIYGRFKNDPLADKDFAAMLGPVLGFADKKESPGCQAADLMLMGAIRQERTEHGVQPSDIERSSFADPKKPINMEDVATFRIPTTKEVLRSLRENMFVQEAARRDWAHQQLIASRSRHG
jgi:hypothetical protein